MAVTVIYGCEPYMIEHYKSKSLTGRAMHFTEFSEEALSQLRTLSLFGAPEVLVDAESLSVLDHERFWRYLASPSEEGSLVVVIRKVDERTKAFKKLKESSNIILRKCDKLDGTRFQNFLLGIVKKRSRKIEADAFQLLMERLGYSDPDVNLYTCGNAVMQMLDGTDGDITRKMVEFLFPAEEDVNRFQVGGLIESRKCAALYEAAAKLTKDPGPIPFLMLLQRELRIAYKARYFKPAEIGTRGASFKSWRENDLIAGMSIVGGIVEKIKRSEIPENVAIATCFRELLVYEEKNVKAA